MRAASIRVFVLAVLGAAVAGVHAQCDHLKGSDYTRCKNAQGQREIGGWKNPAPIYTPPSPSPPDPVSTRKVPDTWSSPNPTTRPAPSPAPLPPPSPPVELNAQQLFMRGERAFAEGRSQDGLKDYIEAGKRGHLEAQFRLGNLYSAGVPSAIPKDEGQAEHWWALAAAQGHSWASVQLRNLRDRRQQVDVPAPLPEAEHRAMIERALEVARQRAAAAGLSFDPARPLSPDEARRTVDEFRAGWALLDRTLEERWRPRQNSEFETQRHAKLLRVREALAKGCTVETPADCLPVAQALGNMEEELRFRDESSLDENGRQARGLLTRLGTLLCHGPEPRNTGVCNTMARLAARTVARSAGDRAMFLGYQVQACAAAMATRNRTSQFMYCTDVARCLAGNECGAPDRDLATGFVRLACAWGTASDCELGVRSVRDVDPDFRIASAAALPSVTAPPTTAAALPGAGATPSRPPSAVAPDRTAAPAPPPAAPTRPPVAAAPAGSTRPASPDAARLYDQALYFAKDEAESMKLYRQAAELGHARAQAALGFMYLLGKAGQPKNEAEAVRWFQLAAKQGDPYAQGTLARMYASGDGVLAKDEAEAARLHKLAAEQGNPSSQVALGKMYQWGHGGLAKDRAEALKWYEAAAKQGNSEAQRLLAGLNAPPVRK